MNKNILIYGIGAAILYFLTKKKNNEKGESIVDKTLPKFSDDKILKMTKEAEVFYDDDNSTGINNFKVKL